MQKLGLKHRNPAVPAVVKRALAGMSFLEISEDLGITRCSVAGIVYRARGKGMVFPTTRSEEPEDRPKPAPRPEGAAPPRPVAVKAPKPRLVVDANYAPQRVTIMELRDGICRWPLWDNDAPPSERFYCGNESDAGHVYCGHCRALSVASKPAGPVTLKHFSMKRRMAA